MSTVGAAVADAPTSAADNDFASYVPKTAFLFPGQGAQTVGMAKVSPVPALPCTRRRGGARAAGAPCAAPQAA